MLTVKAKYAIKALVHLARRASKKPVLISEIAEREAIPRKFLECILLELKNDGLLNSRRGKNGGYVLGVGPESISIERVVSLVDGPLSVPSCARNGAPSHCNSCDSASGCALRLVLTELTFSTEKLLRELTIDELIRRGNAEGIYI